MFKIWGVQSPFKGGVITLTSEKILSMSKELVKCTLCSEIIIILPCDWTVHSTGKSLPKSSDHKKICYMLTIPFVIANLRRLRLAWLGSTAEMDVILVKTLLLLLIFGLVESHVVEGDPHQKKNKNGEIQDSLYFSETARTSKLI